MSKSILIIDTPSVCIDCPCHFAQDSGMVICGVNGKQLLSYDIETFKPDWCPLREEPQKKADIRSHRQGAIYLILERRFINGYNTCIDEIFGEGCETSGETKMKLVEPNEESYALIIGKEQFGIFDLFYTSAGYKTIGGKPLNAFVNHSGDFIVDKSDKTIGFIGTTAFSIYQDKEYSLLELIKKG